ncbi:MAG: hypothetical protein ACREBG_17995 [Pyrinomonadaceae bacterium]
MYCPQCGTESTSGQGYCRLCGANIKVIGKAVSLSEAIARSDRGPLPKIKEMMKSLKIEHVTEEVSRALDQMNKEIVRSSDEAPCPKTKWLRRREKTAAERRENHIVKGTISLFSGAGLTIFLYYLTGALVLKLPQHIVADIPFEIEPVVRVLWLFGLIPALSGLGRIIAGLTISTRDPAELLERAPQVAERPPLILESEREPERGLYAPPASVTERTTNILHQAVSGRGTSEIEH